MGTDTFTTGAPAIQLLLLGIQVLTLLALMVYVAKTWEMASATRRSAEIAEKTLAELRDSRDLETAPYVIAYFDVAVSKRLIYLVIQNAGKSIATDIKLDFQPPLQGGELTKYIHNFMPDNSISSIPPNYQLRTIFDTFPEYVQSGSPLTYTVTVTYHGGISSEPRTAQYTLDLSPYRNIVFVHEDDIGDVAKQLEKLVSALTKTAEELHRLPAAIARQLGPSPSRRAVGSDAEAHFEAAPKANKEEQSLSPPQAS